MLRPERLSHPHDLLRADPSRIREDLPQVFVVGLVELVLDDDLLVTVRAEDVELEVTDPMLRGNPHQFANAEGVRERIEVLGLGEPWCELAGFVLPPFAQRHPLQLAQVLVSAHGLGRLDLDLSRQKAR